MRVKMFALMVAGWLALIGGAIVLGPQVNNDGIPVTPVVRPTSTPALPGNVYEWPGLP